MIITLNDVIKPQGKSFAGRADMPDIGPAYGFVGKPLSLLAYKDGTVELTAGSTALIGTAASGTTFLTDLQVGSFIKVDGVDTPLMIRSVTDDATAELMSASPATVAAAQFKVIEQLWLGENNEVSRKAILKTVELSEATTGDASSDEFISGEGVEIRMQLTRYSPEVQEKLEFGKYTDRDPTTGNIRSLVKTAEMWNLLSQNEVFLMIGRLVAPETLTDDPMGFSFYPRALPKVEAEIKRNTSGQNVVEVMFKVRPAKDVTYNNKPVLYWEGEDVVTFN